MLTDFLMMFAAFFAAFAMYGLWVRISWAIGLRPRHYNHTQAKIAVKDCATQFVDGMNKAAAAAGQTWSKAERDAMYTDMCTFGVHVLMTYYQRLQLPKFDTRPNPTSPGRFNPPEPTPDMVS